MNYLILGNEQYLPQNVLKAFEACRLILPLKSRSCVQSHSSTMFISKNGLDMIKS